MRKRLPNVLMLGWEFPPIINGGLGIACHDLSVALSELANITMIIPKSSPDFKMKNMNLVGLNTVDITSLRNFSGYSSSPAPYSLHSVPADLNPYYSNNISDRFQHSLNDTGEKTSSFTIENLYGRDVIQKVYQYADLTAALASTIDFDVIHAHDWMTMLAGMKIKEQSGKPLVMHIHALEVDRSGPDSKGWVYEMEKKGMEYADLLMPVSNYTSENMQKYYGISKNKISVVHNGSTEVKRFRSKRNYRQKTVLFVGRLTRQKGPEKFLDIAAKVLEKNPEVRFVMAGTGDYYQQIIDQSSYAGIGNRFHLTGFLNAEKLRYLLSVSDVYCMPSLSEPFGLSAIEAAQFGIPCVISRQSGVAEVLSGSLKFDYWDVNKAAGYILSLLNDPLLKKKVVADATHNLKNISWNISANKIMQAYRAGQFV